MAPSDAAGPAPPPDDIAARFGLAHRFRRAAVLAVSGPDRESFLQGQLTQDVRGLRPGDARPAAGLTPKGKLLYAGWLVAEPERLLLVLPGQEAASILAHLARYAAFQQAAVHDLTPERLLLGLYGPGAAALAAPAETARLPAEREIAGGLLAPADRRDALESALRAARSVPISRATAEVLRVEAGRPRFGTDADATNLVDEVGLGDAVSSTKGCYVGQEVVARLRTYGRVSRRLVGFRFPNGGVAPGARFADPEKPAHELARVTSVVSSPRLGSIGLGMASRDVPDGHVLATDGGAAAVVTPLPFS